MSALFQQMIKNMSDLTSDEKALVAHCLISSLDTKQDSSVDKAWLDLAETRYKELDSGLVKAVSWQDIKKEIVG